MKRIYAFMLTLVLLVSILPCAAFAVDYSSQSDAELREILDSVRNELVARGFKAENKTVIVDQGDIQIYISGDFEVEDGWLGLMLDLPVVIINNTSSNIMVSLKNTSVNGWSCDTWVACEVPAGKKAKEIFQFELKETDVTTIDEFEEVEFVVHAYDNDNWMGDSIDTDPITIYR